LEHKTSQQINISPHTREDRRIQTCVTNEPAAGEFPMLGSEYFTDLSRVKTMKLKIENAKYVFCFKKLHNMCDSVKSDLHAFLTIKKSMENRPSSPCPPPNPTSGKSTLILSSHLRLGLPSDLLLTDSPNKTQYAPLLSS
jgi:hypothetical protein